MSEEINLDELTPLYSSNAQIQLMEHIASGAKSEWAVYASNGWSGRYDNYQEASKVFNSLSAEFSVTLQLFTRIGTSVPFRQRSLGEVQ